MPWKVPWLGNAVAAHGFPVVADVACSCIASVLRHCTLCRVGLNLFSDVDHGLVSYLEPVAKIAVSLFSTRTHPLCMLPGLAGHATQVVSCASPSLPLQP